ncbi:MAG: UDP-N-acetylglucosamine 1-carboxyvinyltransferase [Firmicutes bacterium]|nr:UDP-N-acetylglucosamine 1-carboxyvinyltransferase [Bacillota bacterium]
MDKIVVRGGQKLVGKVRISGAKNAALAIIAASVLAKGETILENIPRIQDVETLLNILTSLGAETVWLEPGTVAIRVPDNVMFITPYDQAKKLRASNLLLGSLVGRRGIAEISLPGGCNIGSRPMDLHIKGLQRLGVDVALEHGFIKARAGTLQGNKIYLDFPSVGATENIMMAASVVPGTTTVENVAKEPEVVDLANFLNAMGAKIRGAGTDIIKIEGVSELRGVRYAVIPDRIEAGTFMVAAAATGGQVCLENVIPTHLHPIIAKLRETGTTVIEKDESVEVIGPEEISAVDVKTLPYPGFPTDMQSQMMALLCRANGTSVIVENVFENRLQVADELKRMGARIKVEGHTAVVEGVPNLYGTCVKATDLRAGAALLIAGLVAEGETIVTQAQHISRGYENVVEKFSQLGALMRDVEE